MSTFRGLVHHAIISRSINFVGFTMSENTYKCNISKVPILIHLIYVALAFLVPVFILYFVFVRIGEVMPEEFFDSVISYYSSIIGSLKSSLSSLISTGEKTSLIVNVALLVFGVLSALNLLRTVISFLKVFISVMTTKLTLKDGILTGKVGFIKTRRLNTLLPNVVDTRVKDGLWGKVFNYGRLIITTVSATYSYSYVKDANAVARMLLERRG